MLEKTLQLEEKQKKRILDWSIQKDKEKEEAKKKELYEGTRSTTLAMIEGEEAQRKELLNAMIQTTSSDGPVVKVLTNVHGK